MSKREEKQIQTSPDKGKAGGNPLLAAVLEGKKGGQTAPDKSKSGGAPLLASILGGGGGEGKKGGLTGAVANKARLLKAASLVRTFVKLKGKNQSESASTHGSTLPPKYENSYHMEPDHNVRTHLIEKEIKEILNRAFKNYTYEADSAREMSTTVSTLIMDKMKTLGFKRFRFVCNVTIAENSGQSMGFFSRCIWEPKYDTFATVSLEKESFYVIATVHAVYFE